MKDASPLQQLSDEIGDYRLLFYGGGAATVGAHSGVACSSTLAVSVGSCLVLGWGTFPTSKFFGFDYKLDLFFFLIKF